MTQTSTERVKAFRERRKGEKEAKKREAETYVRGFMRTPFSEWITNHANFMNVEVNFDIMGVEPPSFEDETDPRSFTGQIEKGLIEDGEPEDNFYLYPSNKGALGRADIMIDQLLDAATELSSLVNEYKRNELSDRIAEIEASDLSEPEVRKQALTDLVRLNKMLDKLDKPVRRVFDQWKVTG